jgi:hypothetical protein
MEAVRKIIDGSVLATVVNLPASMYDGKVEIIVFPAPDDPSVNKSDTGQSLPGITRARLDELKKNSKVATLRGSIPHPPTTMAEIREERLSERYGHLDRQ